MQRKYIIILLLFLVIGTILFFQKQQTFSKLQKISIDNHTFTVEIADTDNLRTKGLSQRKNLPPDSGMLFLFSQKGIYPFWMKDMLFPLDFIWIDGNSIVDLTQHVPPPLSFSEQLPFYTSIVPVDKVLEVTAGTTARFGIKKGDTVKLL